MGGNPGEEKKTNKPGLLFRHVTSVWFISVKLPRFRGGLSDLDGRERQKKKRGNYFELIEVELT